ncbi:MAG: YeeE/YedE family protein [Methylococcaceae bacterium]|nr:YeeE/YedE family protein [Methylococcaceae bacterium]
MNTFIIALVSGIVFGVGLALSQMTNPSKVLNFLDIAGNWDPSLMLVMVGALTVTILSFTQILKRPMPLFDKQFYLSSKSAIDKPLIIGASIFGMGWGISGYCPGPAVAGLGLGNSEAIVMIFGIYMGFIAHRLLDQ